MPVTGVNKVKSNMKKILKDISDKKAVQFINAVVSIGASQSKEFAPLEYGTLVNSMFTDVGRLADGSVIGSVSYMANYAAYLEFNTNWSPRPINMKAGPATNMAATPHFLRRGFEEPESTAAINKAKSIFKV